MRQDEADEADDTLARWWPLPFFVLASGLAIRIASFRGRAFAHDDFMIGYTAWMRSRGAVSEREGYLLIYTPLTDVLSPLFRMFPESLAPIDIGRALVLLASLAFLSLSYLIARRVGAPPAFALAAVALASWQAQFTLRVSDLRTDPFATLMLVSSIALIVSAGSKPKRLELLALAGLFYGVAVPLSIKQAVCAPFLLFAVVVLARRDRPPHPVRSPEGAEPHPLKAAAAFVAGSAVFPVLFASARILEFGWQGFLGPWAAYVGGGRGAVRSDRNYVLEAIVGSPFTFALVALGAVGWLLSARAPSEGPSGFGYTLVVSAFLATFLLLNPYVFPYNFTLFMPLLAPVAAGAFLLVTRLPGRARPPALAVMCLLPVLEGVPATAATLVETNERARSVLRYMWTATSPAERVFDYLGMHLGRKSVFHWWIYAADLPRYRAGGWYSLRNEWRKDQVTLVIGNRRLLWMSAADRAAFEEDFVALDECLFTPGRRVKPGALANGPVSLRIDVPGRYRVTPEVNRLLLDGSKAGALVELSRGPHRLELAGGAPPPEGDVVLTHAPPRRDGVPLPCPSPGAMFYGFE